MGYLDPVLQQEAPIWELVLQGVPLSTLNLLDQEEIDKLLSLQQMQRDYQAAYQSFLEVQNDNSRALH